MKKGPARKEPHFGCPARLGKRFGEGPTVARNRKKTPPPLFSKKKGEGLQKARKGITLKF